MFLLFVNYSSTNVITSICKMYGIYVQEKQTIQYLTIYYIIFYNYTTVIITITKLQITLTRNKYTVIPQ